MADPQIRRQRRRSLFVWVPLLVLTLLVLLALTPLLVGEGALPPAIGEVFGIVLLAGIGGCAILETVKRLLPIRGWFQVRATSSWMRQRVEWDTADRGFAQLVSALGVPGARWVTNRDGGVDVARGLTRSADVVELFDIPIEQLAAQFAQVSGYVLHGHEGSGEVDDYGALSTVLVGRGVMERIMEEDGWSNRTKYGAVEPVSPGAFEEANFRAQQSVDHFQIVIGRRWRRLLTLCSLVLSGVLGFVLAVPLLDSGTVLVTMMSLFVGGLVAWTTRDLTAGIARWRER